MMHVCRSLLLSLVLGFLSASAAPPVRIMPVGDSITDGTSVTNSLAAGGPGGGYRLPLWQNLTSAGYNVEYVGLQTVNPSAVGMPTRHEGHSGWKIDQIYSNMINAVFGATEDPDVLLLMIGTNDFGQNYDVNNATNRLSALIGLLTTRWPHCKVIVASLTKRGEPYNTNIQTNFNNSVPGIVFNFASIGKQVYFTDMYTAVPLDAANMPDNLHPNTSGYGRMATNWFPMVISVIGPNGTTNAPAVVGGFARSATNVIIRFSKPLLEASATNTVNYQVPGATVLGASLDTSSLRLVTLLTTPLVAGNTYTADVSSVADLAGGTLMEAATTVVFNAVYTNYGTGPVAVGGAFGNVPEASEYQLVYSVDIPVRPSWPNAAPYDVDLRAFATNFTRVAYYLELQTNGGLYDYAWVSFDAPSTNAGKLGVPTTNVQVVFQQPVTGMNVYCSVPSVVVGTNLGGGNLEFWPINYGALNAAGVTNASDTLFDWGDQASAGNYGSMQVHNSGLSQTILAFNRWGGGVGTNYVDLGIGSQPTGNPDWTFAANSFRYSTRRLQVYVRPAAYNPPVLMSGSLSGISNLVLNFNMPLGDDATNLLNFSIAGATVTSASLDPATRIQVTLGIAGLLPNMIYTAAVSGVSGLNTNSGTIAPGAMAVFRTPAANGAHGNVPEAPDYQLVYSIKLPVAAVLTSVVYDVDLRVWNSNFTRVAYYLELQTNGGTPAFAWTSFEAPTSDVHKIGIPTLASGGSFQQNITNLNVYCSQTNVLTGAGFSGGNIEFWPQNYNAGNTGGVPNASAVSYDFGDNRTNGGNYGSMQVHNHDAVTGSTTGQVIWAFNRWGGSSATVNDLGIGNRSGTADIDWTFAGNSAAYTSRILQVYVLPASNQPPVVAEVSGGPSRSNITIQFSEQVTDASANPTNYTVAGLTVLDAVLDPDSRSRVTLTTSPQAPATAYTLVIAGGVVDRSSLALPLSGGPGYPFISEGLGGAFNHVAEASGYTLLYSLAIPALANYAAAPPAYAVDNRTGISGFDRVAYYLELARPGGPTNWVWVSMDAFTNDVASLGVPTSFSGSTFRQAVSNLAVVSSETGLPLGTNIGSGFIEFWPNAYSTTNSAGVPGASDAVYDWGDEPVAGNYGSMQVLKPDAGQCILAFNNWMAGNPDLGIGSAANHVHPDWTGVRNAGFYTNRVLQVLVRPLPDSAGPTLVSAVVSADRLRIVVTFNEPLADTAAATSNFALDQGGVISSGSLSTNLRQVVLSLGAPLEATITYTLTVNNVRDRSIQANPIAPGSTIVIAGEPLPPQILANAPESAAYQLVYMLPIPGVATNWNVIGTPYATDNRHVIGPFSRVAYYLELATNNGPTNWVWVSMDAFTNDVNKVGVPDMGLAGGPIIQQRVTNLTVLSSATNVTQGTNMAGGNIEFWPYNYGAANGIGIPGANAGTYDFGDTVAANAILGTSGHASMQVHNYAATQTVFAMNHWGAASQLDLGIGNQPTGSPDWTNGNNATNYVTKNLYVLVLPGGDTNGPRLARVQGTPDRTRVLVTFNQPLSASSVVATNFDMPGLTITGATLGTNLHDVMLSTSPQTPDATYALTVANVRDRTTNGYAMASPVVSNFNAIGLQQISANAPESTNFALVYGLQLPGVAPGYNTNGITYGIDLRPLITQNFNRVAYYLELATNGGATNWVYVSVIPPSTNINRIAVPVLGTGAGFQQRQTNVSTVLSSDPGITTGTNITTMSFEMYPLSYAAGTNSALLGGSNANYDLNDSASVNGGNYGAMQVHNYGAGLTVFAFNRWGSGQVGIADVGIGNTPGTNNTDWTFAQNATNFVTKNLYVFVRLTNAPPVTPPAVVAPVFVSHPSSQSKTAGTPAVLGSLASGSAPLAYQWRRNGSPLPGQTNAWLVFGAVQIADAGSYDVVASNAAGVATSIVALLSVTNPPAVGYDAWAAQIGNGLTNYNDSAAGDGYPNLLKYATGSNPTNSDGLARMGGTRSGGFLFLQFRRDTNATDVTLVVEASDSIANGTGWLGIATNLGGSWGGASNVVENTGIQPASVSVQDAVSDATNRFLRLRVTRP